MILDSNLLKNNIKDLKFITFDFETESLSLTGARPWEAAWSVYEGYKKVESETDKILRLLSENNGYLPYHDKSNPEEIYEFFGVSKKVFKMATGALYKQRKIEFTQTGFKLVE
jgi:hypothetical protein